MTLDPDLIGYCLAMVGSVIILLWLQPRWDTGGGALMIFALGIIGAPIWAVLLALVCLWGLAYSTTMLVWYVFVAPVIWLFRAMLPYLPVGTTQHGSTHKRK